MSLADGGSTGLKDKVNQFRDRRAARIAARFDAEPDSWITVHGNHIPLDEDKNPIGGQQKALGGGSEKSVKDFFPKNSYQDTDEFQSMIQMRRNAFKEQDEVRDEIKRFEDEIKKESKPKPKSEWTEEDEYQSLIGGRPVEYTEKGKKLKEEYSKKHDELWSRRREADRDITKSNEIEDRLTRKARSKQLKAYEQRELKESESDDYEGFTKDTTGTSFGDEFIRNGKGFIAEMSPKEYMERCAYEVFPRGTMETTLRAIDDKLCREYAQKMKDGEKFDMPYLDYQSNGQEGRHRVVAAYMNGIEKIPVLVVGNPPSKEDLMTKKRKHDSSDDISRFRNRRQARIDTRMDEEPDSWITVNGNHIPLDENGKAIGGQPKALGKKMTKKEANQIIKKYTQNGDIYRTRAYMSDIETDLSVENVNLRYLDQLEKKGLESEENKRIYEKEAHRMGGKDYIEGKIKRLQDSYDQYQKEIEEFSEAVHAKFPTYDDCKKPEDVSLRMLASGGFETRAKPIYMEDADIEVARDIGKAFDDFCEKCPEMKGKMGNLIISDELDRDDYGYCDNGGDIGFNVRYMKNPSLLNIAHNADIESGFSPKGTTPKHLYYHEMTHSLEKMVNRLNRKGGDKEPFSDSVMRTVMEKLGMTDEECQRAVSKYSMAENITGKYSEWLAEAYAEYLGSEKPREVAMVVGQAVDDELRKRGIRK